MNKWMHEIQKSNEQNTLQMWDSIKSKIKHWSRYCAKKLAEEKQKLKKNY